ncbi:MAG: hypothetical protein ACREQA_14790 [Candidatus Binatia bacterium]
MKDRKIISSLDNHAGGDYDNAADTIVRMTKASTQMSALDAVRAGLAGRDLR